MTINFQIVRAMIDPIKQTGLLPPRSMTHTLSTHHLEKTYSSRKVVNDISFSVKSGQIVGLLGPNGAGKTTSFYMVVGLVSPECGSIMLDDEDISQTPIHQRAKKGIGYLPQEPSVFRKLSVNDNIMAVLELRKDLNKQQREEIKNKLLEEFHISHLNNTLGFSLSGGERRRVEIARALAMEPKFILLDEPFAGIDPISVIDIKRIINHLAQKGIGVLITDHNVRETLSICHQAYIANQGKIIAAGNSNEILNNKLVREVYLGDEFKL